MGYFSGSSTPQLTVAVSRPHCEDTGRQVRPRNLFPGLRRMYAQGGWFAHITDMWTTLCCSKNLTKLSDEPLGWQVSLWNLFSRRERTVRRESVGDLLISVRTVNSEQHYGFWSSRSQSVLGRRRNLSIHRTPLSQYCMSHCHYTHFGTQEWVLDWEL